MQPLFQLILHSFVIFQEAKSLAAEKFRDFLVKDECLDRLKLLAPTLLNGKLHEFQKVREDIHMRYIYSGLVWALLLTVVTTIEARAAEELVDLKPTTLFVPVGFDDNDSVVAVVDGYLPDTCYRLRSSEVTTDLSAKTITVQPKAVRLPGMCMDVTVPYTQVVDLGTLPGGTYSISTPDQSMNETLHVKRATTEKPDDYLYAPVDSAQIEVQGTAKLRTILKGRLTNTCLRIQEVKVINSGKTIEVLPIMEQLDEAPGGLECATKEIPFEQKVALPRLTPGRYLLHVRSLNGQAINEVFTNLW